MALRPDRRGLGVLFGSLPGFTATMGLAVLTPFTFWVKPDQAMAMLLGLLVSAIFSGGVPAILLNTPGTPASIAMTWDGHPLARQGRAGLALGLNAIGAFLGIFLSLVVLLIAALPLSRLALRFGPAEYFAVAVFGLSTIVGVSGGSMLKGLATGLIGLLLAVVGLDAITGYPRFTFGQPELLDGVSFIPVMVGLFGIAEVFTQMVSAAAPATRWLHADDQHAADARGGPAALDARVARIADGHLDRHHAGRRRGRRRHPRVGSEPALLEDAGEVRQGVARRADRGDHRRQRRHRRVARDHARARDSRRFGRRRC